MKGEREGRRLVWEERSLQCSCEKVWARPWGSQSKGCKRSATLGRDGQLQCPTVPKHGWEQCGDSMASA